MKILSLNIGENEGWLFGWTGEGRLYRVSALIDPALSVSHVVGEVNQIIAICRFAAFAFSVLPFNVLYSSAVESRAADVDDR